MLSMMKTNKLMKISPFLLISITMYLSVCALYYFIILTQNNGVFTYTLDDPYIHMSTARHLVESGQWSATGHGYTSASSSPLWVLLITGLFLVFGAAEWVPLFLSLLSGICLIFVVYYITTEYVFSSALKLFVLISIFLIMPMVFVTFTGMEHILHTTLHLAVVLVGLKFLDHLSRKVLIILFILIFLLVFTRLEGLFLVLPFSILLFYFKKRSQAVLMVVAAVLPVGLPGLVSVVHGWPILPISVLLKTVADDGVVFWERFGAILLQLQYEKGVGAFWILSAVLIIALIFSVKMKMSTLTKRWLGLYVACLCLHIFFGRLGWGFRYEAYLIAIGILTFSIFIKEAFGRISIRKLVFTKRGALIGFVFIVIGVYSLVSRANEGITLTPRASRNIYQQHYQIARFVGTYYQDTVVGVNDIGAVGFYTDVPYVDLWGLADKEIGNLRLRGQYSGEEIGRIAIERNMNIAVIYRDWFQEGLYGWSRVIGLPNGWQRIATWTIPDNVITGGDTVTFYAVDPEIVDGLRRNLQEFAQQLPSEVSYNLIECNCNKADEDS